MGRCARVDADRAGSNRAFSTLTEANGFFGRVGTARHEDYSTHEAAPLSDHQEVPDVTILPGWNSLETVTKIHRVFEIAGIACLAALVVFETFAYLYDHRKDVLVEELQAPRRLSSQQRDALTQSLSRFKDEQIFVEYPLDAETTEYAEDFQSALRAAGWMVWGRTFYGEYPRGVLVVVNDGAMPSPAASALYDELTRLGLKSQFTVEPGRQRAAFQLIIGLKVEGL